MTQRYLSDPVQQRSQPAEQHTVSHQPSPAVLVPPKMEKSPNVIQEGQWEGI
jgi:hypothetical protein